MVDYCYFWIRFTYPDFTICIQFTNGIYVQPFLKSYFRFHMPDLCLANSLTKGSTNLRVDWKKVSATWNFTLPIPMFLEVMKIMSMEWSYHWPWPVNTNQWAHFRTCLWGPVSFIQLGYYDIPQKLSKECLVVW